MWTAVLAQCVMCYRTAAAQQAERSNVLNAGIVVLLVPPLLVIAGIFMRVRASSNKVRKETP